MWASFMGHVHCVRTLIVMGASVNLVEEESGKTGEARGRRDPTRFDDQSPCMYHALIDIHTTHPDASPYPSTHSTPALHFAVVSKKTPVVAVLVEYNASRDIADKEGKTVRDIVYEDNEETGGWKNYNQSMRELVRHSRAPFFFFSFVSRPSLNLVSTRVHFVYPHRYAHLLLVQKIPDKDKQQRLDKLRFWHTDVGVP